MTEQFETGPYVVCPLQYEKARLHRCGVGKHYNLQLCGMGSAAIWQWSRKAEIPKGSQVWLAGLAGGLSAEVRAGRAYNISQVHRQVAVAGQSDLRPPLQAIAPAATMTSVAQPLVTKSQKAEIYALNQSDLVDMEAVAFAEIAEANGWQWGVIRGVSDDCHAGLPSILTKAGGPDGQIQIGKLACSLACHPHQLPSVITLARNARRSLNAVAASLIATAKSPA